MDLGAGGMELEGGTRLATVVELFQSLGHKESCNYQGDPHTHKRNKALCPQGQCVISLHHRAAKACHYTTQPTEGVTTPTHVGGELDTGLLEIFTYIISVCHHIHSSSLGLAVHLTRGHSLFVLTFLLFPPLVAPFTLLLPLRCRSEVLGLVPRRGLPRPAVSSRRVLRVGWLLWTPETDWPCSSGARV